VHEHAAVGVERSKGGKQAGNRDAFFDECPRMNSAYQEISTTTWISLIFLPVTPRLRRLCPSHLCLTAPFNWGASTHTNISQTTNLNKAVKSTLGLAARSLKIGITDATGVESFLLLAVRFTAWLLDGVSPGHDQEIA